MSDEPFLGAVPAEEEPIGRSLPLDKNTVLGVQLHHQRPTLEILDTPSQRQHHQPLSPCLQSPATIHSFIGQCCTVLQHKQMSFHLDEGLTSI